jgi:hypothetical protein
MSVASRMYRGGTSRLTLNIGAQENADTTNTATMDARMVANSTCSDPTHNAEMRRGRTSTLREAHGLVVCAMPGR